MPQDTRPGYTRMGTRIPAVTMSHSHTCCLVHVVFATAERRPMIREDIQELLYRYIGGIARENGIPALAVGGAADHIHLLLSLPRTVSVAKAVQLLNRGLLNGFMRVFQS